MDLKITHYWHKTKRTGVVKTERFNSPRSFKDAFIFVEGHASNTGEPCGLVWQGNNVSLSDVVPQMASAACASVDELKGATRDTFAKVTEDMDRMRNQLQHQDSRVTSSHDLIMKMQADIKSRDDEIKAMREEMREMRKESERVSAEYKGLLNALPMGRKKRTLKENTDG